MEIYIARSKTDDRYVLTTGWPTLTALEKLDSYLWKQEEQSGLIDDTIIRITWPSPEQVYKHIRKGFRETVKGAAYGWGGNNYKHSTLTDKKFQKDFWDSWGKDIIVEKHTINLQTNQAQLDWKKPLSEFYPKNISPVRCR